MAIVATVCTCACARTSVRGRDKGSLLTKGLSGLIRGLDFILQEVRHHWTTSSTGRTWTYMHFRKALLISLYCYKVVLRICCNEMWKAYNTMLPFIWERDYEHICIQIYLHLKSTAEKRINHKLTKMVLHGGREVKGTGKEAKLLFMYLVPYFWFLEPYEDFT